MDLSPVLQSYAKQIHSIFTSKPFKCLSEQCLHTLFMDESHLNASIAPRNMFHLLTTPVLYRSTQFLSEFFPNIAQKWARRKLSGTTGSCGQIFATNILLVLTKLVPLPVCTEICNFPSIIMANSMCGKFSKGSTPSAEEKLLFVYNPLC